MELVPTINCELKGLLTRRLEARRRRAHQQPPHGDAYGYMAVYHPQQCYLPRCQHGATFGHFPTHVLSYFGPWTHSSVNVRRRVPRSRSEFPRRLLPRAHHTARTDTSNPHHNTISRGISDRLLVSSGARSCATRGRTSRSARSTTATDCRCHLSMYPCRRRPGNESSCGESSEAGGGRGRGAHCSGMSIFDFFLAWPVCHPGCQCIIGPLLELLQYVLDSYGLVEFSGSSAGRGATNGGCPNAAQLRRAALELAGAEMAANPFGRGLRAVPGTQSCGKSCLIIHKLSTVAVRIFFIKTRPGIIRNRTNTAGNFEMF